MRHESPRVDWRLLSRGTGLDGQTQTVAPEVCKRAVRIVIEHASEHPSAWAAITSIACKIKHRAIEHDKRPCVSTEPEARVKALEREYRELRGLNEILRKASAQLPQTELGRRGT